MTQRQELMLGILMVIVVVALVAVFADSGKKSKPVSDTDAENTLIRPIPALTDEVRAQLAQSKGFQALVMYTDSGFTPQELTIQKGNTVRFTNNSTQELWVAANGSAGKVYPGKSSDECGQSAFDSCRKIPPQGFWEFTFDTPGTWGYQNNLNTDKAARMHVQ